jgi:hypothetical protein
MTDYNNLFEIFKNNEKELDLPLLKNREKEKGKKKDEEKENTIILTRDGHSQILTINKVSNLFSNFIENY